MHIKLLHLRTGKFLCRRCEFSANMINSIKTHYKIKHPEAAGQPDYEERSDDKMIFSHEFWKDRWGIPTLNERKALVRYLSYFVTVICVFLSYQSLLTVLPIR